MDREQIRKVAGGFGFVARIVGFFLPWAIRVEEEKKAKAGDAPAKPPAEEPRVGE